jgi:hypothetical protein
MNDIDCDLRRSHCDLHAIFNQTVLGEAFPAEDREDRSGLAHRDASGCVCCIKCGKIVWVVAVKEQNGERNREGAMPEQAWKRERDRRIRLARLPWTRQHLQSDNQPADGYVTRIIARNAWDQLAYYLTDQSPLSWDKEEEPT